MPLNIEDRHNIKVIRLSGKIDFNNYSSFESDLEDLVEFGYLNFVFDLSKIEYLSSSGVMALISIHKKIREKSGKLVLVYIPDVVINILKNVKLDDLFEIYEDMEEALSAF